MTIDAAIVRIMKKRKFLLLDELQIEVINLLKEFLPDSKVQSLIII